MRTPPAQAAGCLAALLSLAACGSRPAAPPAAPATATALSRQMLDQLPQSVFEIVEPKWENPQAVYEEPLPWHLLPAAERNDKYNVIGTAFAIGADRYVSAAHVFAASSATGGEARLLRDRTGAVHELAQVVRYSQHRDLIEFTLATSPASVVPLVIRPSIEVGETVYTVGNALAEGLAVRSGDVASFTPEPIDGPWRFIRFSAPASPGNSGGPLVDTSGRVVGIVVRKTEAENLNFAVPITELAATPTDHSEFFVRHKEFESGTELIADDRPSTPLPRPWPQLAADATAARRVLTATLRARFELERADKIFPGAPDLALDLEGDHAGYYPGVLDRGADGHWQIATPGYTEVAIAGGRRLWVARLDGHAAFIIERPSDVRLEAFLADPRGRLDALLGAMGTSRIIAGTKVKLLSLGEPFATSAWRDRLGRPWLEARWHREQDADVATACTPYASGVACLLYEGSPDKVDSDLYYAAINAPRYTFAYDGGVDDWREFLALPADLKPTVFAGAELVDDAKGLRFRVGDAVLHVPKSARTDDDAVTANFRFAAFAPPALAVSSLGFQGSGDAAMSYFVERIAAPLADSTTGVVDTYGKLTKHLAPYDGKIVVDDASKAMKLTRPTATAIQLTVCTAPTAAKDDEVRRACKQVAADSTMW